MLLEMFVEMPEEIAREARARSIEKWFLHAEAISLLPQDIDDSIRTPATLLSHGPPFPPTSMARRLCADTLLERTPYPEGPLSNEIGGPFRKPPRVRKLLAFACQNNLTHVAKV